jgi:hypothetical protein
MDDFDPGMTPDEAIEVLREWSACCNHPELADDLRACADVLKYALDVKLCNLETRVERLERLSR